MANTSCRGYGMNASSSSGTTDALGSDGEPESGPPTEAVPGAELLAALLDGMDAALCAFDADGTITHWNREAERVLGWTADEAVGRSGFAGWAVRSADAGDVQGRLMAAMDAPGRSVHEFALLRKDGGRVLVRTQSAGVRGADGKPAGVYCAFSEVHAQIDLERAIALSEALFEEASWGVVLVDVDLRPTVVNAHAARALGGGRTAMLGRPLGDLIVQGVEDLEGSLHHVLAEGPPAAPAELWVTLRTPEGDKRRCWRSGFLRLASPLAEEPVPLGVGWLFQDVTAAKLAEQEADRLRFRSNQLHRAAASAAECEDPMEAATATLDYALAGFADHVVVDLLAPDADAEDPVRCARSRRPPTVRARACRSPAARVRCGTRPGTRLSSHWTGPVRYGRARAPARAPPPRRGRWSASGPGTRSTPCARCSAAGAGRWAWSPSSARRTAPLSNARTRRTRRPWPPGWPRRWTCPA